MLTVQLRDDITAEELNTNEPYLISYLKGKDLKVGYVTSTKVGFTDSEGIRWTVPIDFINDWPKLESLVDDRFKTIGAELTKGARL